MPQTQTLLCLLRVTVQACSMDREVYPTIQRVWECQRMGGPRFIRSTLNKRNHFQHLFLEILMDQVLWRFPG